MSSRKTNIKQFHSISATSMAATVTSPVTDIQFLDNIGIEFDFTGAPVGSFQVQVSASYSQDMNGNVQNVGSWSPVVVNYWDGTAMVTATAIPTSVGSPVYIDLNQLSSPFLRVVYTRVSGSGTLDCYLTAKMI